jgi:hypothetical protein
VTAHVQTASNGGAPVSSITVTVTTTAGNYLTVTVFSGSSTALTVSSVTDSSGANTWNYSTGTNNATPPAAQVFDTANSTWCLSAIAWSQTTAGVTTVTVTMSGTVDTFLWVAVDEWSGVPAGSAAAGVADLTDYTSPGTSWTSPSITAPANSLVVITAVSFSGFTAANTAGFTLEAGGNHFGAWALPSSAGSYSCNFTQAAGNIGGSSLLAIGPSGTDTSPAYATAASDLSGGPGSWVNPGSADGAPDSSYATWTAP